MKVSLHASDIVKHSMHMAGVRTHTQTCMHARTQDRQIEQCQSKPLCLHALSLRALQALTQWKFMAPIPT